ncbi:hypothetical protein MFLAVUS_003837 [Mucor flavus]|uniref:Uncharacterized protein n=1 Tax=Mucor flavus TaxID=439312 RepID=A0ABP9YU72_9FUNG
MLKAFRVVEKDAPEKVNGIVTCIEISTGERDYWQTRTIVMHALIVTFFICFKIWKAHNANR